MKIKVIAFIPALIFFFISLVLFVLPGEEFHDTQFSYIPNIDKIVHIGLFFTLTFLFCRPFKNSDFSAKKRNSWFLSIAFYAIAYGIIIEFIQKYFVPNRSYDNLDILADSCGSLLAYFICKRWFAQQALK